MATLKLEIVTPEEKIYSEDVEMVTLPGSQGELGVYPKHVPLLTTLKPGELRVVKNGRETAMAIGEGFVEIRGDAVSVLTDMALESEKIDIAAAEAAVERAKAAMKEDHSAEEVAAIQASLQKALAQLHVKRRRHHGPMKRVMPSEIEKSRGETFAVAPPDPSTSLRSAQG